MKGFSFIELLVALALSTVVLMGAAGMIVLSKATVGEKLRSGDAEAQQGRILHKLHRDLSQMGLGSKRGIVSFDQHELTFMSARGGPSSMGADLHFIGAVQGNEITLLASPNLDCRREHFSDTPALLRSIEGVHEELHLTLRSVREVDGTCVLVVDDDVALKDRPLREGDNIVRNDWTGATLAHDTQVTWRFHEGQLERSDNLPSLDASNVSERAKVKGHFRYFSRAGVAVESDISDVAFVEIELSFARATEAEVPFIIERRYALQPAHLRTP